MIEVIHTRGAKHDIGPDGRKTFVRYNKDKNLLVVTFRITFWSIVRLFRTKKLFVVVESEPDDCPAFQLIDDVDKYGVFDKEN